MLAPGRVIHADGVRRVQECTSAIDPFSGSCRRWMKDTLFFPRRRWDGDWPTRVYVSDGRIRRAVGTRLS
jgi:hypothetical protein